ncbi:hypothetical protein SOVF_024650 [Spinacia oleracea]|nr:hypothetical protein SOVF_024650 [Spinacia oleracea]
MQFSKAGLDVSVSDMGTKRKKVGSCESEVDASQCSPFEVAAFKPVLIETVATNGFTYSVPSHGPDEQHSVDDLGGTEPEELIEVAIGDSCKVMNLDDGNSSHIQCPDTDKKSVAAEVSISAGLYGCLLISLILVQCHRISLHLRCHASYRRVFKNLCCKGKVD